MLELSPFDNKRGRGPQCLEIGRVIDREASETCIIEMFSCYSRGVLYRPVRRSLNDPFTAALSEPALYNPCKIKFSRSSSSYVTYKITTMGKSLIFHLAPKNALDLKYLAWISCKGRQRAPPRPLPNTLTLSRAHVSFLTCVCNCVLARACVCVCVYAQF